MPILNNTDDLQKHVAIAQSFQFPDYEPYLLKAVAKFTRKYVGNLHLTLAEPAGNVPGADILNEARGYLQAALANFGFYLYTPVGSINVDGSGMSTSVTDHRQGLAWGEKKDIQRVFLSSGHEAMDQLLECMESNKAFFPDWVASTQYTENHKLLVNNTATFNDCYTIYSSRQTYLALQPAMRQVEDQYLNNFLCPELIAFLKTDAPDDVQLQVKNYLQKAIVAFTIAKVAEEGIFTIDAASIMLKFTLLPTDNAQAVDKLWLDRTVKKQEANGTNYLKMVTKIITANSEQFNQCAVPIIVGDSTGGYQAYNTQSVLAL